MEKVRIRRMRPLIDVEVKIDAIALEQCETYFF